MTQKPSLLYVGDIGGHTGLARVADNLLAHLADAWAIRVVSLNHPPQYVCPYPLVDGPFMEDRLGILVTRALCQEEPPDVLLLYMDPAPTLHFLSAWTPPCPVVAYMPVDAENVRDASQLGKLAHALFLTEFGLQQARQGGYTGLASVLGHGVDRTLYHPHDRMQARQAVGLPRAMPTAPSRQYPQGSRPVFLFGNVNRNQIRKRWDLTLYAFKLFLEMTDAPDAYLYCHCQPYAAAGWDLPQLAQYWGLSQRVGFPPRPFDGSGVAEWRMPLVYSALDVQISTTQGEGFGLTHLEGMACGVPQLLADGPALREWAEPAAVLVPTLTLAVAPGGTNLISRVVDPELMALHMQQLYASPAQRHAQALAGLALSQAPQHAWPQLAQQLHAVLEEVVHHAAVR